MKFAVLLLSFAWAFYSFTSNPQTTINDTGNMKFELVKEKIIIPVQINNKTYRFLVDTGGILEISEALQKEFNFNEVESRTIIDINRNETVLKTVAIPEIELGNWTFQNRTAVVSDLHHKYPYSCFNLDGMIGRDFFDNVLLHFDFASNTFRLTENMSAIPLDKSNRTKLKLSKRGLPEIKLKINEKSEFIEFDSGSGDFYSPKTNEVQKRWRKNPSAEILEFQGIFSFGVTMENVKPSQRYLEKIERFQLANATFSDFYSQFSKVSAPRIGAGILPYGKVTLDYKNGWFYFQSYTNNSALPAVTTFGFDIAILNGNYRVKYILTGSKAERLGLRSGDEIVMINNRSTENVAEDCQGYLYGYAFKNREQVTLTFIDNEGVEKSIKLNSKTYK